MVAENYSGFCENLHHKWDSNELTLVGDFGFDLNALPEPYLKFGSNGDDICFLTTNPGGVMDFQKRPSGFFKNGEKYHELSERLAKHYEDTLQGPAKTRIQAMYKVSNAIRPNSNGFTQFEISPFHSSSFPNKEKFANFVLTDEANFHSEYIDVLTEQLKDRNCICIQSGLPDMKRLNKKWLQLITRTLSVDKNDWKVIGFKLKNGRPTTGAFWNGNKNRFKVILFNSGSNSMPNLDSMNKLIDRLRY